MAKRWTREEDEFIHAYFGGVGDAIGPRDLHRPKGAVVKRAASLKASGAWAALDRKCAAEHDYLHAVGVQLAEDDAPEIAEREGLI